MYVGYCDLQKFGCFAHGDFSAANGVKHGLDDERPCDRPQVQQPAQGLAAYSDVKAAGAEKAMTALT